VRKAAQAALFHIGNNHNMTRLIYGIALGTFAWLGMALADSLSFSNRHWLRKKALIACCRLGGLGGGIDEGADTLIEKWGPPVVNLLHEMRCNNQIPDGANHGAYVYDTIDHGKCDTWKRGVSIDGIKISPQTSVEILDGYYKGKIAKLVGLHQYKPFPIYEAKTYEGTCITLQENNFKIVSNGA